MKKAINVLIAGCLLGAIVTGPFNTSDAGGFSVEAAPSLAFITGVVTDLQGKPLDGAIVAVLERRPRGKEIKSARTDTKGRFSASVSPGTYRLRAEAAGFIPSLSAPLTVDRPAKTSYNFALKSSDTLVQRRGDSNDYRWISNSVRRHAMNLHEGAEIETVERSAGEIMHSSFVAKQASFHGMMQFLTAASSAPAGIPAPDYFVSNFAVSGSVGGNFEMAIIGQRGSGESAAQRFSAVASTRPGDNHQITAMIGYGRVGLKGGRYHRTPLEQFSVSATDSWQVFQPLLVIYGFDYSRFVGDVNNRDSVLPRIAIQYSPNSRLRMSASVTPGRDQRSNSVESFNSENIQASLDAAPPEVAYSDSPIPDRSQRFEVGFERMLGEGNNASIEASGFYDLISGRAVGLMALPLEASPETQATFQQVAHHVAAMNGAARGVRVVFNRRINDHMTASAGYSFGRGSYINNAPIDSITPAQLFRGGFFQVATAKLDLDFTEQTGTRVSTVIRLSPSAVIFAIDPFAGRMSVYDPNINIYVTQELPNFGLPVRWEALVDVRNLLDQINGAPGAEENGLQFVSARTRRMVRGGLAFRW